MNGAPLGGDDVPPPHGLSVLSASALGPCAAGGRVLRCVYEDVFEDVFANGVCVRMRWIKSLWRFWNRMKI